MHAPKRTTWWIAVILMALSIIMYLGIFRIPILSQFTYWFAAASSILLIIATRIRSI